MEKLERDYDSLTDKMNVFHSEFYDKVTKLDDIFVDMVAAKNGYLRCLQEQSAIKCQMVELETAWVARRRMDMLALPNQHVTAWETAWVDRRRMDMLALPNVDVTPDGAQSAGCSGGSPCPPAGSPRQ